MSFLKSPVFDSEEKTQHARMVHTVACTTMLVVTLILSAVLFLLPSNVARFLTTVGSVNIAGLVVLLLNRRGYTRAASVVFVAVLVLLMTGLAPTAGGIRAPAMTFAVIIVMMAGLLLGERVGTSTGVICVAIGFGLLFWIAFELLAR